MTLPVLAFPSGTTATASDPPRNGLIAVGAENGLQIVDPRTGRATRLPGGEQMGDPAWSPDGKLLAVSRWDEGSSGVYTVKPDGSDLKLVLQGALYPSWSPDGKWLAAAQDGASLDETATALVIVKADGSEQRELAVGKTSYIGQPQWSPDGKRIAFMDDAGHIKLITPDGETVAVHRDREVGNLSWSPDSSMLAFDAMEETGETMRQIIVVLDLATGKETVLRGAQKGAGSPAWSPDGMQLAFLSLSAKAAVSTEPMGCGGGEHLDTQLWVMAPDGTNAHPIAKGSYSGAPAWARSLEPKPEQEPKASDVPRAPRPSGAVGPRTASRPPLAPSTAKQPRRVSPVPSSSSSSSSPRAAPPLSTDNGLVAARAPGGIYLIDPVGGNVRKVPGTAAMDRPTWSPEGRLLAVEQAEGAGGTSVYTIWPDGSHPQLVLRNASSPSWSADGERLFVVRGGCGSPDGCDSTVDDSVLLSVRADGSDVRQAEYEDIFVREPGWPVDGSWIAFFEDVSAEDPSNPATFDSGTAAWSPDGTKLAFVSSSRAQAEGASADDAKTGLWVIDAEWGKPRFVASGSYSSPSWGPATPQKSSG